LFGETVTEPIRAERTPQKRASEADTKISAKPRGKVADPVMLVGEALEKATLAKKLRSQAAALNLSQAELARRIQADVVSYQGKALLQRLQGIMRGRDSCPEDIRDALDKHIFQDHSNGKQQKQVQA
jgi:hypothetical protein